MKIIIASKPEDGSFAFPMAAMPLFDAPTENPDRQEVGRAILSMDEDKLVAELSIDDTCAAMIVNGLCNIKVFAMKRYDNIYNVEDVFIEGLSLADHKGHDPVHSWFELSYAQYLTIPRSVLQSMPQDWQSRFVKCLEELDELIDWRPKSGCYWVKLKDDSGRYVTDPLMDYQKGRRTIPFVNRTDDTDLIFIESENQQLRIGRVVTNIDAEFIGIIVNIDDDRCEVELFNTKPNMLIKKKGLVAVHPNRPINFPSLKKYKYPVEFKLESVPPSPQ